MRKIIIGFVILVGVVSMAGWAYFNLSAGSGEASQEISAPELTEVQTESTTVYRIVPEESEVRFVIDEVLRGSPYTVVGKTNQVAGDIAVDTTNPANTQVGTIRVNARTLATDSDQRNRALRSFILKSADDAYEFVEFQPTALEGLPESVSEGETFSFQVVGDLTVAGTTQSVTFDATATLESSDQLTGQAVATVMYPDFNLSIPSVPFVAGVDEDVRLEIDFVAQAVAN